MIISSHLHYVYSNTLYIPAQDERVCRSYRFHNHSNKNFSSLVSSALISLYLPLSLPSLPREAGAFDIWQNKRLSTELVRSLPLPSKIDSCDSPFRVLSFVFFLRQSFFLLALLLRAPVCTLSNLLLTRGRVEENRRDAFLTDYPACTSNEPSCTNYRKLVHFLSHSDTFRRLDDRRIVPPNCPSSTRRVFYRRSFYRTATRCFPPGARSFFVIRSFLWFNTSFKNPRKLERE